MDSSQREISSIYCLKFLAAIMVLLIHFPLCGQQYFCPIIQSAVGIFFAIGGYFIYSSDPQCLKNRILRQCKKLVKLAVILNIIYFIINSLHYHTLQVLTIPGLLRLVLHGDNICGHLWFFNAYIWALLFIFLCITLKCNIYFCAFVIYVYGQLSNLYSFIIPGIDLCNIDKTIPISVSIPLFAVGCFLKEHSIQFSLKKASIIFIVAVIISYIENRILAHFDAYKGGDCIGATFVAIGFVILALSVPDFGKSSILCSIGKNHSANFYYWQYVPAILFGSIIFNGIFNYFSFFIVLFCTLLISCLLNRCSVTKYLFS